ncbi:hypothetical protein L3X38_032921 [Prunus dulcis]|uniref:RNase H type-1 domain-containing protein n=1 Tax=Prunus dulcis TaxID=3755 RepID=A0AAD4VG41_PRUDU|nr:hypothetical protein L3X38_032921 [Prunus dulcis]
MSKAPLLSTPEPGDILMIYLSVSAMAVSSVLIRPHQGAYHSCPNQPIAKAGVAEARDICQLRPLLRSYWNLLLPRPWFTLPISTTSTSASLYGHCMSMVPPTPRVMGQALSLSPQIKSSYTPSSSNSTPPTMSPSTKHSGLWLAKEMGAKQIQIFNDSQLVVHQVNQDFSTKDTTMTAYLQQTHQWLTTFDTYRIS